MVPLTRLNGAAMHLNADLIATVEEHHDTVVTLVDGRCVVISESADQVVARVRQYRAEVLALADVLLADPARLLGVDDGSSAHGADAQGADAQVLPLRPSSLGK